MFGPVIPPGRNLLCPRRRAGTRSLPGVPPKWCRERCHCRDRLLPRHRRSRTRCICTSFQPPYRRHGAALSFSLLYHTATPITSPLFAVRGCCTIARSLCGGTLPPHPLARVLYPRAPASRSVRFRRRTPLIGGRLACRTDAPFHVVKMRRRSLRSSFLRNYREARSFSLRVVGVLYPHTPTLLRRVKSNLWCVNRSSS